MNSILISGINANSRAALLNNQLINGYYDARVQLCTVLVRQYVDEMRIRGIRDARN